jgi:hypothetical protein
LEEWLLMLKAIFGNPEIKKFSKALASDIAKRYPPALDVQPGKRPSLNRLTRIIEDACKKAEEFQEMNGLGWLGKARLANVFRWELEELGYQKDLIELATEALIVSISKKK